MTAIIRNLGKSAEIEKLFSFYPKVFKKTPITFFTRRINNDPYLILNDIRIAEENEKIVSSVTVFRRKMHWKGQAIHFAGIGNVSTLPEKRGCGLASNIIKDTIKYIEEIPLNMVILFTGINDFYKKFNFFTIPTYHLKFQLLDEPRHKYTIRNYSKYDFPKISRIYNTFNKNLFGPVIRDNNYWKANLKFAEKDEIFLIAKYRQQIDGYIRIVPGKIRNDIWEFGYSKIEAFNALIYEASRILNKKELKTEALCPKNMICSNTVFKVFEETSSIAMALLNNANAGMKEEFKNYCFWWTDNF
jgi:predicted N-acetyltransferase YhbS